MGSGDLMVRGEKSGTCSTLDTLSRYFLAVSKVANQKSMVKIGCSDRHTVFYILLKYII